MFKKTYKRIALLILSISLLTLYIINNIEAFNSIDSNNTSATEKLKHSNTMYWYSRALGNTNIEFDEARKLALESIQIASKNKQDSTAENTIKSAKKIIQLVDTNREENEFSVNNRFPFFIDLMNTNQTKEEDFGRDYMDKISSTRVLDKLIHLNDFSFSKDLSLIPYFTIINQVSGDKKLEESSVQYLNLNTNFYTISDQEFAQIFNKTIPIQEIISDSLKLKKIADFFDTKQILIIDIIKNDQYKGVYYYSAKAKRFDLSGPIVSNKYVETFAKERQFNTIFGYKLPLVVVFILITLLIYFLTKRKDTENERIKFSHFLISTFSSIVFSIVFIELIVNYLSPVSGEYYETDTSEIWRWAVSFSFTFLPLILVHLVIGKMDHYIEKFDSGLDIKRGVFSILLGTFMCFPVALAYYGMIRFSIDFHLFFVVISILVGLFYAYIISYFWIEIKNRPQESILTNKIFLISSLVIEFISYLLFVYNLIGLYNWDNTINTLIWYVLVPNLFLLGIYFLNKKGVFSFLDKGDSVKNEKKTEFIKSDQYEEIKKSLIERNLVVLYGIKGMGKSSVAKQLMKDLKTQTNDKILIDFSINQSEEESKVNYYPFAFGLKKYLSFKRFNNHADEARKSGNVIGKLLNSISSVGELLVVDKASDPENVKVISKQICKILDSKEEYLLVFENIHLAKNENEKLLFEILHYFKKSKKIFKENSNKNIIFTANEFYSFKNTFENLIETIAEVKIKRNKLFDSDFFFRLRVDSSFIKQCLKTRYDLSVFDYYDLLTFFEGREIDKVPGDIIEILNAFENNETIKNTKPGHFVLNIEKQLEIPTINQELTNFESIVNSLSNDEMNFLLACVYSCDRNEEFEINALAFILSQDRIEVLQRLRYFEEKEIIFDIKEKNDWFRFSDARFILAIKNNEGYVNDEISQLGKEYFRRFVLFYHGELQKNSNLLSKINVLFTLLNKTLFIAEDLPKESVQVLVAIGTKFIEPEISYLQEAESAFVKAHDLLANKENEFHFESIEEMKEDLMVTKLLKTFELKNDFENNRIKHIIDNYKDGKYKNEITQFLYLQFSKSSLYKPDIALQKQIEIANLLPGFSPSLSDIFRLKFYSLLLTPKNGASLEKLIDLDTAYVGLIYEIEEEVDKNTNLNYLLAEVINSRTSLIVDSILVNNDMKNNHAQQQAFFNQFKILVQKRIHHELKKIELDTSFEFKNEVIENDIEFLNYIFSKSIRFDELQNLQKIDRKGLCFTYNFIVRSFFAMNLLDEEGKELLETILKISSLAVAYNRKSDDIMGQIMSENFHGKILTITKDYSNAFESIEYAYYIAHKNGKRKDFIMSDMHTLISKDFDENLKLKFKHKIDEYETNNLINHILRHFSISIPNEIKEELKNKRVVLNDEDLKSILNMPGSKFLNKIFNNPIKLLEFVKNEIQTKEKKQFLDSVYFEIEFDELIAEDCLISLDSIEDKTLITKENRSGYMANCIDASYVKPIETNKLIVIVDKNDYSKIRTLWPGKYSPDFPRQIRNVDDEKEVETNRKCSEFWENHAFIISKK